MNPTPLSPRRALSLLLLLSLAAVSANVRDENLAALAGAQPTHARGLLEAREGAGGVWHFNQPDAPEVTGATIKAARQVTAPLKLRLYQSVLRLYQGVVRLHRESPFKTRLVAGLARCTAASSDAPEVTVATIKAARPVI